MKGIRIRGLRLRRKLSRVFKWITRRRKKPTGFLHSFDFHQPARTRNPISKIMALARNLRHRARKTCCFSDPEPGHVRLGQEAKRTVVPKGQLAVYVGDGSRRVVVPVMYFNHPLFEGLLNEAERVYGYNQTGGLMLPCGYSEFEKIKIRIDTWSNSGHFWRQTKLVS